MIKDGDISAKNKLISKYRSYSWAVATDYTSQYPNLGIDAEELMLVAFNCFFLALKSYRPGNNTFYAYWRQISTNDINRYIHENSYLYNAAIFSGVPLDKDIVEDDTTLHEAIGEEDYKIKDFSLTSRINEAIERNQDKFLKKEKIILDLYLAGYSLKEIAKKIRMKESNIYYTFNCLIDKLSKFIK